MSKEFSLPEVSNLDEVPEEYRPFYFEKDGQVQRQNPQAMVSTMAKIRRENEKLSQDLLDRENRLQGFVEVLGDDADPDIIKGLKDKAAKAEQLPTNDEVEKRIRLVEENAKKQLEGLKSEKAKLESIIEKEAVEIQIKAALSAANANKDGLDLLPQLLRGRVEKKYTDDGRIELIPLDEDGSRMYTQDGSEATLVDLANKTKDTRPVFFNGTGASGVGATGQTVTIPKNAPKPSKMTPQEKRAFQKEHGDDAWAQLVMREKMHNS